MRPTFRAPVMVIGGCRSSAWHSQTLQSEQWGLKSNAHFLRTKRGFSLEVASGFFVWKLGSRRARSSAAACLGEGRGIINTQLFLAADVRSPFPAGPDTQPELLHRTSAAGEPGSPCPGGATSCYRRPLLDLLLSGILECCCLNLKRARG